MKILLLRTGIIFSLRSINFSYEQEKYRGMY